MSCEQAAKGKLRPRELKVDISFNLGWKEQRSCSVKKITQQLKESLSSMKIIHTLSDALSAAVWLTWHLHSCGKLTPLCCLPGGDALLCSRLHGSVYVIQPSLQFLLYIDRDLGPGSHFG